MYKEKLIWNRCIHTATVYFFVLLSHSYGQSSNPPVTQLRIHYVDKDSLFNPAPLQLQTSFTARLFCMDYINKLPLLLASKGYPTASVDSTWFEENAVSIALFTGRQYHWMRLMVDSIEKKALDESGFVQKQFSGKLLNIKQLQALEHRILSFYEKSGYPFAEVYLDSIQLEDDRMNALLKSRKGPFYHVDSIRVFGKEKISRNFLYHYLNMTRGSIYNKDRLLQVGKRLSELPYLQELQPNDITLLGSGSILNLYLAPKRSSEVNVLIGLLPGDGITSKFQFTGDVKLNLKNALAGGETILVNWQQLQRNSPRLNIGFQQPYVFNSPFGFDFLFDLFKKDSTFLQINAQVGAQYLLSANQSGKIFVQWQNSYLLANGVDTNQVKASRRLPPNIDVTAVNVGLDYEWIKTNYLFNPRRGNELSVIASTGIKNIKKNNDILALKDPSFNYESLYDSVKARSYQFRIRLFGAHYFPVAKQATVKMALTTGIFSSQHVFRNELFQIGGFKLLRGFDEESIYATQFGVATVEYRYLLALRSYLFGFIDEGWVKYKYQQVNLTNTFMSAGIGMVFETKFGLLNISYAVGKRNDVLFNIRESSKIHFGYINYF